MSENWVTVQQLATMLGVSESTARRRIETEGYETKRGEQNRLLVAYDASPPPVDTAPTSSDVSPPPTRRELELLQAHNTELKQQITDLNNHLAEALKQQDQAQQLVAMQQQMTEQNQRLLEAPLAWWQFWRKKNPR